MAMGKIAPPVLIPRPHRHDPSGVWVVNRGFFLALNSQDDGEV